MITLETTHHRPSTDIPWYHEIADQSLVKTFQEVIASSPYMRSRKVWFSEDGLDMHSLFEFDNESDRYEWREWMHENQREFIDNRLAYNKLHGITYANNDDHHPKEE